MTLNDIFMQFDEFAKNGLELEHYFSAGEDRFVNVRRLDDGRISTSVNVSIEKVFLSDVLKEVADKLKKHLSDLDNRDKVVKMQPSMVMGDIQPYISMIDGSLIESRSKHRTHLKDHNCVEVGNETKYLKPKPMTPPPGLKEKLIEVVHQKIR